MKVRLKLYGVFRSAAGSATIELEIPSTTPTVRIAIDTLASNSSYKELTQLLIDTQTLDPRPNALIMVSGREINTLNGLETPLLESDELSLLPVAHGGWSLIHTAGAIAGEVECNMYKSKTAQTFWDCVEQFVVEEEFSLILADFNSGDATLITHPQLFHAGKGSNQVLWTLDSEQPIGSYDFSVGHARW